MHHSNGDIKQNKMTYHMVKWVKGLRSYEFLTDFVFATCCEIGERAKVVICSLNMNRFL